MKKQYLQICMLALITLMFAACNNIDPNNQKHVLNVKIEGEGIIEPSTGAYVGDTVITFIIIPKTGWVFSHWEGTNQNDVKKEEGHWHLFLNGSKDLKAIFTRKQYNLNIHVEGEGRVEETLLSQSNYSSYPYGSLVELTAVANTGWQFKEWQGDIVSCDPVIEVEVGKVNEVIAIFEQRKYNLEISIQGEGEVREQLIADSDSYDYPFCSVIRLTALPDPGWVFKEWRNDVYGTNPNIYLTINRDMTVKAIFQKENSGGTVQIFGSVKISHTWPHPYNSANQLSTSKDNIGKIPVLHTLGVQEAIAPKNEYANGQLLVGFQSIRLMGECDQAKILQEAGVKILKSIPELNVFLVAAPSEEMALQQEMERLSNLAEVAYVEPNHLAQAYSLQQNGTNIPNDPYFNRQWHYNQIRLPHAWSVVTGSPAIRIAVLDTGINHLHPDLKDRVDLSAAWNFSEDNSNTMDKQSHGSHCAGTIGAATNNRVGVAGVMWDCTLIPVKVLDDMGYGYFDDIAEGILYAAGLLRGKPLDQPAHIISMSLGGGSSNQTLQNACRAAADAGVLIVCAAGNNNGPIGFPARYEETIAVGSTGYDYPNMPDKAYYSCYGPELDIMAPGGDTRVDTDGDGNSDGVLSSTGNGYQYFQGTSMACPHIAGLTGLMLANGIPANKVRNILRNTAMDLGNGDFSYKFGYGLVNAYWAVNNVENIKIVVGTKTGDTIEAVAEGTIDLRAKQYVLDRVPTGTYQVFGWIDVQDTNTIDPGDYLFASEPLNFQDYCNYAVNMDLKEVK